MSATLRSRPKRRRQATLPTAPGAAPARLPGDELGLDLVPLDEGAVAEVVRRVVPAGAHPRDEEAELEADREVRDLRVQRHAAGGDVDDRALEGVEDDRAVLVGVRRAAALVDHRGAGAEPERSAEAIDH